MRFKDAMRDFKGKSVEARQGGNGEAPSQDLPPQNVNPQNLHPQNLPPQDNGPGLIYPATRDSTALDQVVGLTDQPQQQQDWLQPRFLHPHDFNATPGPAPRPAPRPVPRSARRPAPRSARRPAPRSARRPAPRPAPINTMPPPPLPPPCSIETPQFTMMPLLTEADFIMDDGPSEPSQHYPN
ncbi:hypothetical protein FP744_10006474 [Trichoderma asperellum]|nr:hypothetical protein LI328DRAFT_142054 [Trichoderma asperelloides]